MRLEDREWKEFVIGRIFKQPTVAKYNVIPEEQGNYIFISSSSENNGSVAKCNVFSNSEPCITVSTNGACFDCFYHDTPIAVSSDVEVLTADWLNAPIGLFLCCVMKQEQYRYSYGRKPKNNKVRETIIRLPIQRKANGSPLIDPDKKYSDKGYIPDWQFMEDYIKSLEPQADISELLEIVGDDNPQELTWFIERDIDIAEFREYLKPDPGQDILPTPLKLTDRKWKIFKVRDFFSVTRGSRIVKNKDFTEEITDKNIYPVITAKTTNNGIDGYYQEQNCEGKCIVVCGEASGMYPTYQENPCWLLDTVREIKPKIDTFNLHIALFIMTLLRQEMYKYDFTRKAKPSDILETALYLPVTAKETPDWQFMEDYIRSLNLRNSVIR